MGGENRERGRYNDRWRPGLHSGELLDFIWREVIEGIDMFRLHFRKRHSYSFVPFLTVQPCYKQNDLHDTMAIGWPRIVAKEWVAIGEVQDSVNNRAVTGSGGEESRRTSGSSGLGTWGMVVSFPGWIFFFLHKMCVSCLPQGTEHHVFAN